MSVTSNQLLDKVKADIAEVTVAQVEADLKAGKPVHVVDVRERDEVMDGYIPGAELIPRGFLELNVEDRSDDLNDLSNVISHDVPIYPYSRAAEPPTISAISCVIWA